MLTPTSALILLPIVLMVVGWIYSARDSVRKRRQIEDLKLAIFRSNWVMSVAKTQLQVAPPTKMVGYAQEIIGVRINNNCILLGEPINGTRKRI
jgi:hypothetical protein